MNPQKKIVIFYHAYAYGDKYMTMMTDQFRLLVSSGLYNACDKLFINISESPQRKPIDYKEWLNNFWSFSSSKGSLELPEKIVVTIHPTNNEETDTLKKLRDYCANNPNDYVLYFHTKGISKQNNNTEDWRKYMEFFTIEKWQDCVKKLDNNFDACGVMWNSITVGKGHPALPTGTFPHFSGGFWWAKASHINSLKHDYLTGSNRYLREFWIGSNPRSKMFEFHNSGLNTGESLTKRGGHYNIPYPRDKYAITKTLHIICTAYNRPIHLRMFIDSMRIQTCDNWKLYVVYDGKAPQKIKDVVSLSFDDSRIQFIETPERLGNYGHPNRGMMLDKIKGEKDDFVLITNEDNYYPPVFVDYVLKECKDGVGFVYTDTVHSFMNYGILKTKVKEDHIDMGSFIVRLSIAKAVGFKHTHFSADGTYAEECYKECLLQRLQAYYIQNKAIFVHN